MKEDYWIRGRELERFNHQQEQQALMDKQQQVRQHRRSNYNWRTASPTWVEPPSNNNNDKHNHNKTNRVDDDDKEGANAGADDEDDDDEGKNNNLQSEVRQHKAEQEEGEEAKRTTCAEDMVRERSNSVEQERKDKLQARAPKQQQKKEENAVNLSFCGCGFLGIYHVGVASCFHQYAPQLSMHKISGSSAGALVAVSHICGNLQLAYATTDILRVAIDARARALGPFHPSFDINATIREALQRGLPEDVHLKATGKLHVSLTRVYDGANVIVSEFASREDVIQVLLCSCFIPFWSGLTAPKYKGVAYIDGGFSNNLLTLDDKTVTVSPFAGEADICPQDDTFNLLQVNLSNTSFSLSPNNLYRLSHALLPPPPEILSDLCEQGFADGIKFLQRMKLISCTKCLEIRSSLLVTTNGGDMEEAFNNQVHCNESMKSTSSFSENHHIRLEQQEQKMVEIYENDERRSSVVSTTSQVFQPQHQPGQHYSATSALFLSDYDQMMLDDNCDECVLMRERALYDPLPKQYSDRIRDACDTVNKSLSNWIYSHRPIKYLSYLAAPYLIPVDISLALVFKCWQRLPFIRSEVINCVQNIVDFLIGIVKRMQAKSTTSMLMGSSSSSWEEDAIEYEKEMIRLQQTVRNGASAGSSANDASSSMAAAATTLESSISVKITTSDRLWDVSSLIPPPRLPVSATTPQLHSLEDTFDSIVDVTSNQEARIFAYYFRDAKNRLQVTEIFDLERVAELSTGEPQQQQQQQQQSQLQVLNHHHTPAPLILSAESAQRQTTIAPGAHNPPSS